MATVLDIGALHYFKPIFTFLFVFVIMYALLQKTKILGGVKGVDALVSFVMAILFMLTPGLVEIVDFSTSWFVVLFIFIILTVVVFMILGVQEEALTEIFRKSWFLWTILIVIGVFIFGFAATKVYGPGISGIYGNETSVQEKDTFTYNLGRIIFHPRALAVFFILLVASQAVRLISRGLER
jgi:hypothetical protein